MATHLLSCGPMTSSVGSHRPSPSPSTICARDSPCRICGDPWWRIFQVIGRASLLLDLAHLAVDQLDLALRLENFQLHGQVSYRLEGEGAVGPDVDLARLLRC